MKQARHRDDISIVTWSRSGSRRSAAVRTARSAEIDVNAALGLPAEEPGPSCSARGRPGPPRRPARPGAIAATAAPLQLARPVVGRGHRGAQLGASDMAHAGATRGR